MAERELVCVCHWGGKKFMSENGEITYNGGIVEGIIINGTTTFTEFVKDVEECLSLDFEDKHLYYTTKDNKTELIRMSGNQGLKAMFLMNDRRADIYIEDQPTNLMVNVDQQQQRISSRSSNALKDDIPAFSEKGNDTSEESSVQYQNSFKHVAIITEEGQLFNSPDEFKEALALFGLKNHFSFQFLDNSRRYYRVVCTVTGCPWKLTAGCDGDTNMVRVKRFRNYHNHTAHDVVKFKPVISSKEMGRIISNKVRDRPSYLPRDICNDFKNEFSINMTYMQGWRAKERAKAVIEGSPEDSYKLVPWMCQRITEAMPGSVVEWTSTAEGRFKQLFVAYSCSIRGFHMGCRPFLSIDACHLSGNYKGTLVSATAYDADDGLYPLAYAVVSSENDEDWIWFLQKLKRIVGGRIITLMTDRHPSLIKGVSEVFNGNCHAWCMRHLKENFTKFMNSRASLKLKAGAKDTVKHIFDEIGYARSKNEYEKALQKMAAIRIELHDWVLQNGPEHWTNYLFPLQRWDKLYSNQAESFNSWVKEERQLSITRLMDGHIRRMTEFLLRRKQEIEKWKVPVGPRTEKRIKANLNDSVGFKCMVVSPIECTVYDRKRRGFTVRFQPLPYCSCMEWQMSGLPCPHACCAIEHLSFNVYDFVQPFFGIEAQRQIFEEVMSSIPTFDMPDPLHLSNVNAMGPLPDAQSSISLKPPSTKRAPGRPRVKRIESQFQNLSRVIRCSRCHEVGHNRRNCKNPIVAE